MPWNNLDIFKMQMPYKTKLGNAFTIEIRPDGTMQ